MLDMVSVLSYSIISPLGDTAATNYAAVSQGRSGVKAWQEHWEIPGTFMASLFDEGLLAHVRKDGLTRLESLALASIHDAMSGMDLSPKRERTMLVLSTTKGNIELLGTDTASERVLPISSAVMIAKALRLTTTPIVVDNACVSGLSALILAQRLIETDACDRAIVCGVECQSKFIISGFQSLKAMSSGPCRPFDIDRMGLNLGEAVATMVLGRTAGCGWSLSKGAQRNDAYHLGSPSKEGLGAAMVLREVTDGVPLSDIGFINAHGTATLFNDQMESVAIERAGLSAVPVNGLKGCYGHTMGACGLVETIISMQALDHGVVLPTKGFAERGVSGKIKVSSEGVKEIKGQSFVKMLSGFGGCNVAVLMTKNRGNAEAILSLPSLRKTLHVQLSSARVMVNGKKLKTCSSGRQLLTELYKTYVGDYSRFYKMDMLSRLGFVATELLLRAEGKKSSEKGRSDRAIVFIGHSGSVVADKAFYDSIKDADNYFPSPERFVYTLPNIVTGEVAIRNHYHGETAYYSIPEKDDALIGQIVRSAFLDTATRSVIGGWLECGAEDEFEADIYLIEHNS